MLSKIKIICIGLFLGLLFASPAYAARFYLSPSSGNIIKGCNKTIDVMMDLTGEHSNAGQIYIDHNFVSGEYVSLSESGGKFETYSNFSSLPAGRVGKLGYGGDVFGPPAQKFGQIVIRGNTTGTVRNLNIYFAPTSSISSKIADLYTSSNILTSVESGSYTVIDGYCDTVKPNIIPNLPKVDGVAYPVSNTITYDVTDDNSGIDIGSLTTTLKQKDYDGSGLDDVTFVLSYAPITNGYRVTLDPVKDLIHQLKATVYVYVKDKAGNFRDITYEFNDLTCAQLGCYAMTSTPPCSEPTSTPPCPDATSTCPICPTCDVCGPSSTVTSTVTTTIIVTPENNLMPVHFYLDNRSVEASINDEEVSTLSGTIFTVAADTLNINETINFAKLVLEGKELPMYYDNTLKMYSVDVMDLVTAGFYQGSVVVNYGADRTIISNFTISVLNLGFVNLKTTKATTPFAGVSISLQKMVGSEYSLVKKVTTDSNGTYGFVVPNGNYRLVFEAPDFDPIYTSGFTVENNIINRTQLFIESINLLDPTIELQEKIDYLAGIAGERGQELLDLTNDPQVEKAVQNYAAPIALGAALAATAPALSFLNLISYLRFLFLQPIFLLGMRRRKKWGTVYNALTKMPADLAVVRLLDANTNRVVQSRVTDAQGRYVFLANPGTYRLIVEQKDMIFPSKVLQDFKEDTSFLDIYHGEIIHVDEKYTVLAVNIPLDPLGAPEKTPARIVWDKHWRDLQKFIAALSVVAGLVAVLIAPSWWTGLLLASQILLYYLFKRIAVPKKPKSWGIVYDKDSKKPVNRTIARLFSKQFNKLVSTEITDNNGRYSFMVGPSDYFVTFEKDGYQKATTPDIKIKEKDEVIKIDTGMERLK